MPTKRTRLTRNLLPEISETAWRFLNDEPQPAGHDEWELFCLTFDDEPKRTLWYRHREKILSCWIEERPGTRPSLWWRYDAPRLPEAQHGAYAGWYFAPSLITPRLQTGGKALPKGKRSAIVPSFEFGIPKAHAEELIDPDDPPQYESQAAYLKRHGLLTNTEKGGTQSSGE